MKVYNEYHDQKENYTKTDFSKKTDDQAVDMFKRK